MNKSLVGILLAILAGSMVVGETLAQPGSVVTPGLPSAVPYILTPKPKPEPRINGPRVYGVRPGRPILYTIAATGQRPMTFSATGLPPGAAFDPQTGRISGAVSTLGCYRIAVRVENALGHAERELRLVVGEEIALTPPMGCNSWGGWGPNVSDANIRASAEAMVRLGLIEHGYTFINIDDGWQGRRGGAYNAIQPNEKFGDMHGLCEFLHGLGLKAGIYSTPWAGSYAGFVGGSSDSEDGAWKPFTPVTAGWRHGKHRFAAQDARQSGEWGFDYFKYDWAIDQVELAREMGDALRQCNRDLVFELSNSAPLAQAEAFTRIGTMCRTTGDIVDVWDRSQLDPEKQKWALGVRDIWNQHKQWEQFNRPGHWNMPCPLRVGLLGGWDNKPLRPTRLTVDEQYSHISLWCLWSAPLIIGCPLEKLDEFTLNLLTNDEVLEIDQDPLGKQARQIEVTDGEVLIKELEDGSKAVGLFNVGLQEATITVRWSELGIQGQQQLRDLWRQRTIGSFTGQFAAIVPAHGVILLRISPVK